MYLAAVLSFAAVVTAATSGCGSDPPTSDVHLTEPKTGRQFILHVPSSYNKNKATGMIVMHHGFHEDSKPQTGAESAMDQTQFGNDSINPNLISVFPEGQHVDGLRPGQNWYLQYNYPDMNDFVFIRALLDHLETKLCLNTNKYYAAGFSNGGGFTNSIACNPNLGPRFAAFGINSGPFYYGAENADSEADPQGTGCMPGRNVTPIMEIHGLDDPNIDYDGNQNALSPHDPGHVVQTGRDQYTGVLEWLEGSDNVQKFGPRWAQRNNCATPKMPQIMQGTGYKYFKYAPSCALEHYQVKVLGHAWARRNDGSGQNDAISSTRKFLGFFNNYSL